MILHNHTAGLCVVSSGHTHIYHIAMAQLEQIGALLEDKHMPKTGQAQKMSSLAPTAINKREENQTGRPRSNEAVLAIP